VDPIPHFRPPLKAYCAANKDISNAGHRSLQTNARLPSHEPNRSQIACSLNTPVHEGHAAKAASIQVVNSPTYPKRSPAILTTHCCAPPRSFICFTTCSSPNRPNRRLPSSSTSSASSTTSLRLTEASSSSRPRACLPRKQPASAII